jgi:hypothetical protein
VNHNKAMSFFEESLKKTVVWGGILGQDMIHHAKI